MTATILWQAADSNGHTIHTGWQVAIDAYAFEVGYPVHIPSGQSQALVEMVSMFPVPPN